MGSVLIVIFTPLAKNVLTSDERVASLMIATFSVGVAIGSVIINAMLKGKISARYSPVAVIAMAVFVVAFSFESRFWVPAPNGGLYDMMSFIVMPQAWLVLATLIAIAIAGGMFVVPLYAFLTTTVTKDQTARTVAANNIVNAFGMVLGALLVIVITTLGVGPADQLLFVAGMAFISAWIAQKLHRACD
jgi:MFS family permease